MPRLPVVSGGEVAKALGRLGFTIVRQKGSHLRMKKGELAVTIPLHSEIRPRTLDSIFDAS